MTMITPSYLGETIEYSSLHACRSTLEDPTKIMIPPPLIQPAPFGVPPLPGSPGLPLDFPTPAEVARWLAGGVEVLEDAARSARLVGALKAGRLTADQSRAILMRIVQQGQTLLQAITRGLVNGGVRLASWFNAMRDAMMPRFFAGPMALLDDPALPPADVAAIVPPAWAQVGKLAALREQLRTAAVLLREGVITKVGRWARAAWGIAVNVLTGRKKRDGFTMGRRILGGCDHCPGCLDAAAQGWVPLDAVVAIGDSYCREFCCCSIEYR